MENTTDIVKYESAFGEVTLSKDVVLKYLARGSTALNEQEIMLFIQLCKYQKLNPFVGEAYPIKFGTEFQMIVGYDTYKRRGEENPSYRGRKSGIVVLRNDNVTKREGACMYPGDTLLGGWCTVYRQRGDWKDETYSEVALSEYQKFKDGRPQANWGSKPATMIRKVAVSQALRDAFPTQYAGLYSEYDMPNGQESEGQNGQPGQDVQAVTDGAVPITKEERQAMFGRAQVLFGKERGNEIVKELVTEKGYSSTQNLTKGVYREIMAAIEERGEGVQPAPEDDFLDQNPEEEDDYGRPDDADMSELEGN